MSYKALKMVQSMDHPVFISVCDSASFIQQEEGCVCVCPTAGRVHRNTCKSVVQVHPLLVTYSTLIIIRHDL